LAIKAQVDEIAKINAGQYSVNFSTDVYTFSSAVKAQADKNTDDDAKSGDIPFILEQALLIRDERLANDYYRDTVTRARVFRLWVFVLFLTCFAIYVSGLSIDKVNTVFKPIAGDDVKVLFEPIASQWIPRFTALLPFISIAVYGALGATFSALRDFTASTTKTRIPEHVMTTWMTLTRPFVGAVSALIAVFAIMGGLLPAFKTDQAQPAYFVWALAFVAGFSERLVMQAVSAATRSNS
jgi:hypothetical protein